MANRSRSVGITRSNRSVEFSTRLAQAAVASVNGQTGGPEAMAELAGRMRSLTRAELNDVVVRLATMHAQLAVQVAAADPAFDFDTYFAAMRANSQKAV